MLKVTFKKPPQSAIHCYIIGFTIISITVAHQYFQWQWMSSQTNQQVFIIGALIVACGSLLNWILPFMTNKEKNNEKN